MKIFWTVILVGLTTVSCDIKGVESSSEKEVGNTKSLIQEVENQTDSIKKPVEVVVDKPSDSLILDNGIIITYFKKGKGDKLTKGEVVKIDYRAKLEDGTIYDGNHLVKKQTIPFLVGWNQQTSGWDIAMQELRVGDDVDIFLPAKFARGKKGIKGVVPPNANNIISMRVKERFEPTSEVDGVQIWKYDELKTPGDSVEINDKVKINYWVSSESKPRYNNSYMTGEPFTITIGDGKYISGLNKALQFGREGDRLMILIPSKEAFGQEGLIEMVKPGEDIFYDVQISEILK
ncbi:FKBP-type peptidyl-prolyl cis-trans isomerase [Brumimicrobium mesophilum]|uniref:FKBP-type peptidyl-prolyl cis-trans isomerase n=1 Tax=Brumimicrobium mesophilum TaxID=392717 RepID=UPI000D143A45|nr:FKBP-type peptidyl-prolyl cis-trans isomerase [Brumimicrobium mesophilum]